MKTLIGIVTFGNLPFTQLTVKEILATTRLPVDFCFVVGKPGDTQTVQWLSKLRDEHPERRIDFCIHQSNQGFPASINDIYDYAWWTGGIAFKPYDNLIICGNDVIPYPGAVDALIECARDTHWEWICSSMFDVHSLVTRYPEAEKYFEGQNRLFFDFSARPWDLHKDIHPPAIQPNARKDVRNLCLFKRSVFEKIGYADVNFWPGGYFEDNDYCRRGDLADIKACGLAHSAYFHFWSRTIHQQGGSTTNAHFCRNSEFYEKKWGGPFGAEKITLPAGGLKIDSRRGEQAIIDHWSNVK